MIKSSDLVLENLKLTSRLIVERALNRGWDVTGFTSNNAIHSFGIPGRSEQVRVFSASPPQTSYPAVKIAGNKYITNQILGSIGLPVPKDLLIRFKKPLDKNEIQNFIDEQANCVLKPLDSSHGNGITVNIRTFSDIENAITSAEKFTKLDVLLLQQQVDGFDVRILCIDYKIAGAITRTPASVVGDGKHNLEELIDIVNSSDDRGENYKSRLNYIDKTECHKYLGAEKLNTVPIAGQTVKVIGVANIGMGGERKNIFDNTPNFLIEIAEKSSREIDLPVCAVDFMTVVEPTKTITIEELKPVIIELNACPQLLIHDDPHSEEQSALIDKYLDFVAKY